MTAKKMADIFFGNFTKLITSQNVSKENEKSLQKPKIKEIMNSIILSYENFFNNLKFYNYTKYKKIAESMAIN